MGYSRFEARPPQDTIDTLLDYAQSHRPLSSDEAAVIDEAWLQHDLYPCKSGEHVRSSIVKLALAQLAIVEPKPISTTSPIPYILLRANATAGADAPELVKQTNSHLHAAGIVEFLETNRDFNVAAVGRAVAAVLKGIDSMLQDQLMDTHASWLASRDPKAFERLTLSIDDLSDYTPMDLQSSA